MASASITTSVGSYRAICAGVIGRSGASAGAGLDGPSITTVVRGSKPGAPTASNAASSLAAYMAKYMNGAMNPASVTKPAEYKVWKSFNDETFAPVNKAIMAKDMKAFEKAYTAVINDCNACHQGMGYGFIKVVKMKTPADVGINYTVKSEPGDVPK